MVACNRHLSRDGKSITFANHSTLFQVSIDGTNLHKLTGTPGDIDDLQRAPAPLPDVLRFAVSNSGQRPSVWEVSSSGSRLHRVLGDWQSGEIGEDAAVWVGSGDYSLFRSRRIQGASIWALRERHAFFRRAASAPVKIFSSPMEFTVLAPNPDGKRVFISAGQERLELMRYDAQRGQVVPFLSGVASRSVSFAKDGRWVAYSDVPDGVVWRSRLDGSERVQLTPTTMAAEAPQWSPDGTRIAFCGFKPGEDISLYVIPSAGGSLDALAPGNWEPSWSPDGNSLLFGMLAVHGRAEPQGLYVVELKSRAKKRLLGSETILRAAWSPDPRYAAAINVAGTEILLFDFQTERWSTLANGAALGIPRWSQNGKYVYYQDVFSPQQPIYRVDVGSRKIERMMSAKQIPQSNVTYFGLAGIAPGDAPVVVLTRTNSDIYALDLDLP